MVYNRFHTIIHTNQLDRWQEYRDLRIRALRDIPQAFLDDPENAENWPAEEWQKRMENMYFAEEEGKWVGMIGSYQEPKSKLQHIANVVSFFVLPESRGQGIGKALLSRVIEDAKKKKTIKKLQLGVVTTQEFAQQLYLSLGFVKIGEQKYAVKVGEEYFDEYLMEMYL